jgi:hypothetical protein
MKYQHSQHLNSPMLLPTSYSEWDYVFLLLSRSIGIKDRSIGIEGRTIGMVDAIPTDELVQYLPLNEQFGDTAVNKVGDIHGGILGNVSLGANGPDSENAFDFPGADVQSGINTKIRPADGYDRPCSFGIWAYWPGSGVERQKLWNWYNKDAQYRGNIEINPNLSSNLNGMENR